MARPTTGPLPALTRRAFLHRVSRYGSAAVMASLFGLELFARDRGRFRVEGRAPAHRRNRVLVLGGGIAGLVAAYELHRLGYAVQVLEARMRPGGRCWTVRGGTEETELTGEAQRCEFAPGEYFNPGPMRLAHHHRSIVDYCRAFGLPLVPFPNVNEAAFVHRAGYPRRQLRAVLADLRGHTSELLAKVIHRGALEQPLSAEDRERLIEYLRTEGRLDASLNYPRLGETSEFGFHRDHVRGYDPAPGASATFGEPLPGDELEALLRAGYAMPNLVEHDLNQQETMLTIAGGMDRLAHAFANRLDGAIHYGAEVLELHRTADRSAQVIFRDTTRGGEIAALDADFCVCTLPPHLLAALPAAFASETVSALRLVQPDVAGKTALQFRRRFWEQDDDIYGGRSVTDLPITQIYYPFENFGAEGASVLIGAYHYSETREVWDVAPAARIRLARDQGAQIHPQYAEEFEIAFSVEWHRVRHSAMAWPWWKSAEDFNQMRATLERGDGPFLFAGDWMSVLGGWQAGACVAAQAAVRALHTRALAS